MSNINCSSKKVNLVGHRFYVYRDFFIFDHVSNLNNTAKYYLIFNQI